MTEALHAALIPVLVGIAVHQKRFVAEVDGKGIRLQERKKSRKSG